MELSLSPAIVSEVKCSTLMKSSENGSFQTQMDFFAYFRLNLIRFELNMGLFCERNVAIFFKLNQPNQKDGPNVTSRSKIKKSILL